jgi:hypothetical protein
MSVYDFDYPATLLFFQHILTLIILELFKKLVSNFIIKIDPIFDLKNVIEYPNFDPANLKLV